MLLFWCKRKKDCNRRWRQNQQNWWKLRTCFITTSTRSRPVSARLQLWKQELTRLMNLTNESSNTNLDSHSWIAKFKLSRKRTKATKDWNSNMKTKEEKYRSFPKSLEESTTMKIKSKLLLGKLIDWTILLKERIEKSETFKEKLGKARLLQNNSTKSRSSSENWLARIEICTMSSEMVNRRSEFLALSNPNLLKNSMIIKRLLT